jgi:predicted metal-dependent TIM-barrel fold hydrolase
VRPERVIIDHVEEHTFEMVLDAGFWAGITLYPESKCTAARAIDIVENARMERIWLNCACDWGRSEPLAVPRTALEMRKRGHSAEAIDALIYGNPHRFLSQNARFSIAAA